MPSPPSQPRVLVSLATYNERDNLTPLIRAVHGEAPHADVLVIDDNSPDGTGELADQMAAIDPRVHVLHRPGKLGLGTALLAAMRHALSHGFDLLLNMDADFSHHPRYLPEILAGMARHDVMVGSRYVPGGSIPSWPVHRRFLSRAGNRYVDLVLDLSVRDATSGFRAYRAEILRRIDLASVRADGYGFQIEMVYRVAAAGGQIVEQPIEFVDRQRGTSKMSFRIIAEALLLVTWWGVRDRVVGRRPHLPFRLHLAPHSGSSSSARSSRVA